LKYVSNIFFTDDIFENKVYVHYVVHWQQINTGYKQGEEMKKRRLVRSKNELLIGHISNFYFLLS